MTLRRGVRLNPGQIRDLRGRRGGGIAIGGGLGGILLVAVFVLLGGNPGDVPLDALAGERVGAGQQSERAEECRTVENPQGRRDCRIVGYVNSVQEYWTGVFAEGGDRYTEADTAFFEGGVSTSCGQASSAVGPFYCPADGVVYIDLGFFDQLETQFGAEGGELAEAYVIAHEYGHHVQSLLGVLQGGGRGAGAESRAVRTELQADCFAGAWAANAVETGYLEPLTREQIGQALSAAEAVGDDRIQERTQGQVNPETWTHGSAEQRQEWFLAGLESGDPGRCNTFEADL
ncbi:MAG TPA: neutral zinc metallopeptidase [Candidatus Limnocylindria bacterium]|nr:neutral zinc metallopeptidase [Candidatus Limnocylindria bacterium]